jgi:hypothetical protein
MQVVVAVMVDAAGMQVVQVVAQQEEVVLQELLDLVVVAAVAQVHLDQTVVLVFVLLVQLKQLQVQLDLRLIL